MEAKDYLKDIQDIKNMMNKSSQFLSLSGLSGIFAGIYALVGAVIANNILSSFGRIKSHNLSRNSYVPGVNEITNSLIIIALLVIGLSIITGLILSASKAKKQGESLWNATSKRLLINFGIPLVTGGLFALLLLQKEIYGLIAPITLLFYGLGCVNASKHTFRDVKYLGLTLIVVGLLATYFEGYGLYFWALGFGVFHIVYGTVMYYKYDKK